MNHTARRQLVINMKLTNGRVFRIALVVGLVSTYSYHWITSPARHSKQIHPIYAHTVYLTDQIRESDFEYVKQLRIRTIIDMRPDGEAKDQLSSKQVAAIAEMKRIKFEYVPIPHGDIPSERVDQLTAVLQKGNRPILLYCRTGKRALRTFCLAEASRDDGPSSLELDHVADQAGIDIKDLQPEITRRIVARNPK